MNATKPRSASRWSPFVFTMLVISALTIGNANAIPVLMLNDGFTTKMIADNSTDDQDPLGGVVTFMGTFGDFSVDILRGESKPYLGSAASPELQLVSDVTSATSGSLTIGFTDTDFVALNTGMTFNSSAVFTSNLGLAIYSTYLDSANDPFGMVTSLGSDSYGFPIDISDFSSSNLPGSTPYSLTQLVSLNMPSPGSSTMVANLEAVGVTPVSTVPETGILALLGTGLVGFAVLRQKRNRV